MSYPILDSSVKWALASYKKTPNFNSVVQKNVASHGNAGISLKPFCTWDFDLSLPTSNGSIAQTSSIVSLFIGTFAATQGQTGLWLFNDVTDNTVSSSNGGMLNVTAGASAPLGNTGDGSSKDFQLARSLGGLAWDVIQNLNGNPTVLVNGSSTSAFSVSDTGVISFTSAPANGATLAWSGNFRFLCRFSGDSFSDLSMVGYNSNGALWTCSSVKFSSEFV
jgi:hypothetical protein